jgi:hypothetical protein
MTMHFVRRSRPLNNYAGSLLHEIRKWHRENSMCHLHPRFVVTRCAPWIPYLNSISAFVITHSRHSVPGSADRDEVMVLKSCNKFFPQINYHQSRRPPLADLSGL